MVVITTEKQKDDLLKPYFDKYSSTFKYFVRDIIGWINEPFHDELDDDISQRFDSSSPAFKMIKRFFAVFTFPRDHGKSSHLSIAYPLWRIAKDHNVRI